MQVFGNKKDKVGACPVLDISGEKKRTGGTPILPYDLPFCFNRIGVA